MKFWQTIVFCALLLVATSCGTAARTVAMSQPTRAPATPEACPVTRSPEPAFVPPAPFERIVSGESYAWYGSAALWTAIPVSGVWSGLPHNPQGFSQKLVWWNQKFFWRDEPEPALRVSGRRLDAPAPPMVVSRAHGVFADDMQSAMMVGVDIPSAGCWEISGAYRGSELRFVVRVAE